MWKSVGLLAGILIVPITAAGADTIAPPDSPCTRQSAIWRDLFQDPSAARSNCSPHMDLFAAPTAAATGDSRRASDIPAGVVRRPDHLPGPRRTGPGTGHDAAADGAGGLSRAYTTRRKIHFIASFATIPLFVAQYVLGDKLYEGTSGGSTKSTHSGVAVGIETLFAVNTVTGVWNMWESRKDFNAGRKRFIHGFLMLGAGAGFVATGMLAPDDEGGGENRSTHRNVAIASMAVATASYLIMLIGR